MEHPKNGYIAPNPLLFLPGTGELQRSTLSGSERPNPTQSGAHQSGSLGIPTDGMRGIPRIWAPALVQGDARKCRAPSKRPQKDAFGQPDAAPFDTFPPGKEALPQRHDPSGIVSPPGKWSPPEILPARDGTRDPKRPKGCETSVSRTWIEKRLRKDRPRRSSSLQRSISAGLKNPNPLESPDPPGRNTSSCICSRFQTPSGMPGAVHTARSVGLPGRWGRCPRTLPQRHFWTVFLEHILI